MDRGHTLTDPDDHLQAPETQKARVTDFIRQRQLIGEAPPPNSSLKPLNPGREL